MTVQSDVFPSAPRTGPLADWELIVLIEAYHYAHVRDLTEAIALARRVETRHAGAEGLPRGLAGHLARMLDELAAHQQREESILFPMILSGNGHLLQLPIAALEIEHEAVQESLERLVRMTGDYTPPPHACASWRRLYELCRKYDHDFREHLQLEDRDLFPRYA